MSKQCLLDGRHSGNSGLQFPSPKHATLAFPLK